MSNQEVESTPKRIQKVPPPHTVVPSGSSKRVLMKVPPIDYPLRHIHEQIPHHYFIRNMTCGFFYIFRDILQSIATYLLFTRFGYSLMEKMDEYVEGVFLGSMCSWATRLLLWNLFWYVQGLNWTGLWVMAHECGHQAFSDVRAVNDAVGFVLHSFLLVPYHSWRITHGNHHKHTNHLTKDTVFVPTVRESVAEIVAESPIVSICSMIQMLTLGWPVYLMNNAAGQVYPVRANHFEPSSPLFKRSDAVDIVVSDVGVFFTLAAILMSIVKFGFSNVFCFYLAPYLWVNFWLVLITYLQHSDLRVPHYTSEEWTFVRGALGAVDRNFGFVLNWWLHHINDSHVVHHLFSQMPFYNAIQVTRNHVKSIFGEMYVTDSRPIWKCLYESWTNCRYVVPQERVMGFHR